MIEKIRIKEVATYDSTGIVKRGKNNEVLCGSSFRNIDAVNCH